MKEYNNDRTEYFKQYYRDNKEKLQKQFKEKYSEQRNERLVQQENYYIQNSDTILKKMKKKDSIRRQVIIKAKDKPCMDCGVKYPSYVTQFDHRDPSTKVSAVSSMISCTMNKLLLEIAKCDVVCANCHAERTWGPHRNIKQC